MQLKSFYPVLGCRNVQRSREFYTSHFPFAVAFEADWYVSLIWMDGETPNPERQLALLDPTHPSVPENFRKPVEGLLLNFEVENVDEQYDRLKAAGLPVHLELRSEAWGQRHFITADPDGVLLDMIQLIPPSAEFAEMYEAQALAEVQGH